MKTTIILTIALNLFVLGHAIEIPWSVYLFFARNPWAGFFKPPRGIRDNTGNNNYVFGCLKQLPKVKYRVEIVNDNTFKVVDIPTVCVKAAQSEAAKSMSGEKLEVLGPNAIQYSNVPPTQMKEVEKSIKGEKEGIHNPGEPGPPDFEIWLRTLSWIIVLRLNAMQFNEELSHFVRGSNVIFFTVQEVPCLFIRMRWKFYHYGKAEHGMPP